MELAIVCFSLPHHATWSIGQTKIKENHQIENPSKMTETPDEKYESIDIHTNPEPEEPHKEDEDIDQPMIAEPTRGYGNQNILENVSLSASTAGDDEKITKLRKKLVYGWTRLSIWRSWFVLGSSLLTECVSIIWLIFAIAFFFLVPGSFIQILMTVFFLLVALSGILSACPLPLFPMYPRSVFACMMVLSVFISFILMIANFFLTFGLSLFFFQQELIKNLNNQNN